MKKLFSLLLILFALIWLLPGCKSMADTAKTISNDLGDEAKGGTVLFTRAEVKSSSPTAGGAPVGDASLVYGTFHSVPIKAQAGEVIKSYGKFEIIEDPSIFTSKVTRTKSFVFTFQGPEEAAQIKEAIKYFDKLDAASGQ